MCVCMYVDVWICVLVYVLCVHMFEYRMIGIIRLKVRHECVHMLVVRTVCTFSSSFFKEFLVHMSV